jgi:hypothetical protein
MGAPKKTEFVFSIKPMGEKRREPVSLQVGIERTRFSRFVNLSTRRGIVPYRQERGKRHPNNEPWSLEGVLDLWPQAYRSVKAERSNGQPSNHAPAWRTGERNSSSEVLEAGARSARPALLITPSPAVYVWQCP